MDPDYQSSKYSGTEVNCDGIPLEDRNSMQLQKPQNPQYEEDGKSEAPNLASLGRIYRWSFTALRYLNCHIWTKLVIALLLGGGTTAGTTIAVIDFVRRLIASASLETRDGREASMRQAAIIYDHCYKDFEYSHDLERALNACKRTSQITVADTVCDGNVMWTWRDRYPEVCLQALGKDLWPQAFAQLKKEYRTFYGLFVVTAFAGIVIYKIVVSTWEPMIRRLSNHVVKVAERAQAAEQELPAHNAVLGRNLGRRRFLPWYWCAQLLFVANLVGSSHAFPCWRSDLGADARLNFVSVKNESFWGQIHGWTLNCEEMRYVCGRNCSWETDVDGNGHQNCTEKWCSKTVEVLMPDYYVMQVIDSVEACGFRRVKSGSTQYVESHLFRIVNPMLEKNKWVSISMEKLNLTGVTDPSIMCLWEIGNQ